MTILDTLPSVPWDVPASPTRVADFVQHYCELQRMAKEAGITPYAWTITDTSYTIYGHRYPQPGRQMRRKRVWAMPRRNCIDTPSFERSDPTDPNSPWRMH